MESKEHRSVLKLYINNYCVIFKYPLYVYLTVRCESFICNYLIRVVPNCLKNVELERINALFFTAEKKAFLSKYRECILGIILYICSLKL